MQWSFSVFIIQLVKWGNFFFSHTSIQESMIYKNQGWRLASPSMHAPKMFYLSWWLQIKWNEVRERDCGKWKTKFSITQGGFVWLTGMSHFLWVLVHSLPWMEYAWRNESESFIVFALHINLSFFKSPKFWEQQAISFLSQWIADFLILDLPFFFVSPATFGIVP